MQLVKYNPGARFPWHKHAGPEFIYLLEGEVIQRGQRLGQGAAGIAPAGTEEDDSVSETGAIFLTVYTA
jgi:quercetin dioxygenase-like cupin family protein